MSILALVMITLVWIWALAGIGHALPILARNLGPGARTANPAPRINALVGRHPLPAASSVASSTASSFRL